MERSDSKRLTALVGSLRQTSPIDLCIASLVKETVKRRGVRVTMRRGHRDAFKPDEVTLSTLARIELLMARLRPRRRERYTSDEDGDDDES
jgi:hypothetical protein